MSSGAEPLVKQSLDGVYFLHEHVLPRVRSHADEVEIDDASLARLQGGELLAEKLGLQVEDVLVGHGGASSLVAGCYLLIIGCRPEGPVAVDPQRQVDEQSDCEESRQPFSF